MRVKIKDLKPNPFRDVENYPINEEKVQSLVKSVQQTGFWDNILARKTNGRVEIAYGHHRLLALRKHFKPEFEVTIPVKDLDDATMIKIMANENDENWGVTPGIINETVRVAKKFLKEHPEELKKLGRVRSDPTGSLLIGRTMIARFLGGNWNKTRVGYSLEQLKLERDGILDKKSLEVLPTEGTARDFTSAVREAKPSVETQRKVAKKIVTSRKKGLKGVIVGKFDMEAELHKEEHGDSEEALKARAKADQAVARMQFEHHLGQVKEKAEALHRSLSFVLKSKKAFLSERYQKSEEAKHMVVAVANLFNTFRLLMHTDDNKISELGKVFKRVIEKKKEEGK